MSQNEQDKNQQPRPQVPTQTPAHENFDHRGTTPEPKFHIPCPPPKKGN